MCVTLIESMNGKSSMDNVVPMMTSKKRVPFLLRDIVSSATNHMKSINQINRIRIFYPEA